MRKFCEKWAVVEAAPVTTKTIYQLAKWSGGRYVELRGEKYIVLETDKGPVKATIGNWLVKDRNGRVYVFASDVFEQTYRPVDECSCRHVVGVAITDTLVDQIAERVAERLAAELQKAVNRP